MDGNAATPIVSDAWIWSFGAATHTFGHTLGRTPLICQLQMTCLQADGGYSPDDVVYCGDTVANTDGGYIIHSPTSTTVAISIRSLITIVDKDGGGLSSIGTNDWSLRIVVI